MHDQQTIPHKTRKKHSLSLRCSNAVQVILFSMMLPLFLFVFGGFTYKHTKVNCFLNCISIFSVLRMLIIQVQGQGSSTVTNNERCAQSVSNFKQLGSWMIHALRKTRGKFTPHSVCDKAAYYLNVFRCVKIVEIILDEADSK